MRKPTAMTTIRYLLWTGMVLTGFASRGVAQSWDCSNNTTCWCGVPNCTLAQGFYQRCCAYYCTNQNGYNPSCGSPAMQQTIYGNCECRSFEGIQCSATVYTPNGDYCSCGSCP